MQVCDTDEPKFIAKVVITVTETLNGKITEHHGVATKYLIQENGDGTANFWMDGTINSSDTLASYKDSENRFDFHEDDL